MPTLPGMQTPSGASNTGGWVLAPASSVIAWPPQVSLAPAPAPAPESSASLLAAMLQQLQQQQHHGAHFVIQQQPPAQPQRDWFGGPGVAVVLQQAVDPAAQPQQPQQQQTHGVSSSMQPAMSFSSVRSQPPAQEAGDARTMLHKLQQAQEPGGQQAVLQTQDLSAVLLRQHVQSTEPPANMVPTFMSHLGSAAGAEEASTHRLSTGSSSRSGSASTTREASRGSPSNSLSTLLACNELLKSQLHENERRIQHCQVAAAQKLQVDGDSKDGSDDDSTNGTSSSGASTTPSTKESESTPPAGQSRYWTEEEHRKFLEAVRCFGAHNHKAIASYVSTRNSTQVRSHSQKFFKKLETFRGRGLPTMLRKRKNVEGK